MANSGSETSWVLRVFCSISGMQRHDIYDNRNEILNQADYD